MNRNYLFILFTVTIAIILIIVFSLMSATMTLDQIIKNKDCTALSKWEEEHMFDDNLNIPSEQMSAAMKLATECVGKAFKNMDRNPDSSSDITDRERESLDRVLDFKSCTGLGMFLSSHINKYGTNDLTEEELHLINTFAKMCNFTKTNYTLNE